MKRQSTKPFCVYTTMIGRYERLNDQPVAAQSNIPFICLTDDLELTSATWQIRMVSPTFGMDPIRSQRDLKLRPHLHLADFEGSLYIDNTVILKEPPEKILERYQKESGFSVAAHSCRETVLDEFMEVARLGLDDQSRIFEQLNHYQLECPDVLMEKPFWGAILLRDHKAPAVRNMLEIWNAHVQRYARRDQLSMNYAFRRAGLVPEVMFIDNFNSWFHGRSHQNDRDIRNGMRRPLASLMPPLGRLRELEMALIQQRQALVEQARIYEEALATRTQELSFAMNATTSRLEAIERSKSWKVAMFLSQFASRHHRLARFVWNRFERFSKERKEP